MRVSAVLLAAGAGSRFEAGVHKLRADLCGTPILSWSLAAVVDAEFDEIFVVTGDDDFGDLLPESVRRVPCERWAEGQAHSLRAGVEAADAVGAGAIVVGLADQPLVGSDTWRALCEADSTPIVASNFAGKRRPPMRLEASVWSRLPTSGDAGARDLIRAHPDLVSDIVSAGHPGDVDTEEGLDAVRRRVADMRTVADLLGRKPMGSFDVVVRDDDDKPVVLRNFPVLANGRPMPTLYWLCGERESMLVGRLESMKGVRRAEAAVGLEAIAEAHERYRAERDAVLLESGIEPEHRATGGVGGTRMGVKCLHAHYGWWLAGGEDPVGQWVADHLHEVDHENWPTSHVPESDDPASEVKDR